jgi:Mrp family chromosome partitioning ATPase
MEKGAMKKSTGNDSSRAAQAKRPGGHEQDLPDRQELRSRMSQIQHKILVLSGKGGVGKSTVAVNLSAALAMAGKRVGLLDVDIHGPSIPKMLHIEGATITGGENTLYPVKVIYRPGIISIMSIGFLLREKDDAVIWRGPRKFGVIRQFLKDVDWGELDYLVVDSPPGTGDEPLAVAELVERADGALVVTTPQDVAVQDVRRCVVFCRKMNLPVLGVIENMSGFTCPKCGERVQIFGADGGRAMAEEMDVLYLGSVPIEPEVVASGDSGIPMVKAHPHSETAKAFGRIVRILLEQNSSLGGIDGLPSTKQGQLMRIAIPVPLATACCRCTLDTVSSSF